MRIHCSCDTRAAADPGAHWLPTLLTRNMQPRRSAARCTHDRSASWTCVACSLYAAGRCDALEQRMWSPSRYRHAWLPSMHACALIRQAARIRVFIGQSCAPSRFSAVIATLKPACLAVFGRNWASCPQIARPDAQFARLPLKEVVGRPLVPSAGNTTHQTSAGQLSHPFRTLSKEYRNERHQHQHAVPGRPA